MFHNRILINITIFVIGTSGSSLRSADDQPKVDLLSTVYSNSYEDYAYHLHYQNGSFDGYKKSQDGFAALIGTQLNPSDDPDKRNADLEKAVKELKNNVAKKTELTVHMDLAERFGYKIKADFKRKNPWDRGAYLSNCHFLENEMMFKKGEESGRAKELKDIRDCMDTVDGKEPPDSYHTYLDQGMQRLKSSDIREEVDNEAGEVRTRLWDVLTKPSPQELEYQKILVDCFEIFSQIDEASPLIADGLEASKVDHSLKGPMQKSIKSSLENLLLIIKKFKDKLNQTRELNMQAKDENFRLGATVFGLKYACFLLLVFCIYLAGCNHQLSEQINAMNR